jgi:hypothetical protein
MCPRKPSDELTPTIRYFDLQMLLDNEAGTVTEWSKTGEKVTRTALDGGEAPD